jgi:L-alanine-DL-glutamate epimerase-like enolase superfamily enzyme
MAITPIGAVQVDTVAARPAPHPKGVGRPLVTPLTSLARGEMLLRGESTAGLTPASTWAVVVRVSDREGRTGVGTAGLGHPAAAAVVRELCHLVVGHAPADVAYLWETMHRATLNVGGRGVVLQAISAIDIAVWDLLGQQLEQPLYNLLGGRVRDSLPAYASWLYATEDLDALAAEASAWAEKGFGAVKQRLAHGPAEGVRGIRRNVELVRTVVDAVGPDIEVMADAYMGWDVGYAVRCIRAIEDAGIRLRWLEEPLIPDDVSGLARVRRSVSTPIAAGEHAATRYGFRDLIAAEAVDVLQPDVNRLGGITEARRVWALGETFGLDVVPHIGAAHNLHLSVSSTATPWCEYLPPPADGEEPDEDQLFWRLFPDEPRPVDGMIAPNPRAGLGVSLDTSWLDAPALEVVGG